MGNEKSALSGLEIDEKAIEVTDFWTHHSANTSGVNPQCLSVFISEPSLHSTANFGKPSPLERTAKNLMLHRHPCILKYISSWKKGSSYYLATEEAKPLAQVIGTQTTLQICIGLHSILRALLFLHENALASHNNISSSSIYVTPEGSWKLGCLEFLCKFTEFNLAYLKKIRTFRHEKAITPEEDVSSMISQVNPVSIDQYAFGILTEDVLRLKNADDVPALLEFKQLCREQLQNPDPALRPSLSSILRHPFFTHDFINIHAFLMELPLKPEPEKELFFSNLVFQLKAFPEKIVAEQLGRLLLSRMVLLDSTAQSKLLPYVLKPKLEDEPQEDTGLFAVSTFKIHLVPRLLQMFCVRDTSVRLLLLSHLSSYIYAFQMDELKRQILPELLVGIKDHDDQLVSITLRALADLVPILGAATVIGGKRGKLFSDGRPNHNQSRVEVRDSRGEEKKRKDVPIEMPMMDLPERPSPDGGEEGEKSPVVFNEEESTWSDWDAQDTPNSDTNINVDAISHSETAKNEEKIISPISSASNSKIEQLYSKKIQISDIAELDIKHSKPQSMKEEVDFFMDMEPVIVKPTIMHIEEVEGTKCVKSVFDFKAASMQDEDDDGWAEDLNDWGGDNGPDNLND